MNLLSLSGVSKTFLGAPLFEEVTLGIDAGEKIGFVGKNGSGKSTFLKILRGELEADRGIVARNRELTVAAVEQSPAFDPAASIDECLAQGTDAAIAASARSLCRELGIVDTTALMGSLSGGMVRKVSLALCLARGAGFLTLDEPTNHLDLDTIEWLEARLAATPASFVLVTHDRYFLDAVCSSVMEIDGGRIYKYPGNYSTFLERKAERIAAQERASERRATILKRELEWLARGPKARTGKDKGRTERVQDLLDTGTQRELEMREFTSAHRRLGKKVLEIEAATKSYDGRQIILPFSYRFRRGERIGVLGPNGSGKTTFLGLVSGRIAPDGGSVAKGETTVFACFDQVSRPADGSLTILDYIRERAEHISMPDGSSLLAEQFLERFLFPRKMQSVTIDRLSGGELRRLELVRLLAISPNFLLLDEPTNDLDLDTIRLLEDYLVDFPGCMLIVSHDRALLDRLTDYLFLFDGQGHIRGFTGRYADYREMIAELRPAETRPAEKAESRERPRREKKAELSFKERREYEALEGEIHALEAEQKQLEARFQEPTRDREELAADHRRYREIEGLLPEKLARWEVLATRAG